MPRVLAWRCRPPYTTLAPLDQERVACVLPTISPPRPPPPAALCGPLPHVGSCGQRPPCTYARRTPGHGACSRPGLQWLVLGEVSDQVDLLGPISLSIRCGLGGSWWRVHVDLIGQKGQPRR